MMKRAIPVTLVVLAVALSGCGGSAEETPTPEMEMDFVPVVSVTGEVVPAVWATVSAQTGGTVMEVLVEPGDEVAAGAPLALLDPTDAQLAMQQAEASLEAAQAQLALLEAGPRPGEVAAAEAQIEAAQAALAQAAAQRDQLTAGATEAEIAAAEAEVVAAELARKAAEDQYDQIQGKIHGWIEQEAILQLRAAEEALEAAQARLAQVQDGAGAQIRAAQAAVQAAEAQQDVAQAQLDLLQAGATAEEVAVAQVAVAQAAAALETARVALGRAEVRAPFAGTVGAVSVRTGELVAPGQPLVTLGNLATLRVETTDLDEIDVARVAVGQEAAVTFDALPEQVFTGRVTRIAPMAEPGAGGVNYTVIVELEDLDPAIRWGMTAFVDIEVGG
jgi:multidrug efflux pump subunit AcrA (membrane-fusion protein)